MQQIAPIPFTDLGSDDEAHVILRAGAGAIALALTLRASASVTSN
jgi:hypothetical protein